MGIYAQRNHVSRCNSRAMQCIVAQHSHARDCVFTLDRTYRNSISHDNGTHDKGVHSSGVKKKMEAYAAMYDVLACSVMKAAGISLPPYLLSHDTLFQYLRITAGNGMILLSVHVLVSV